MSRPLKGSSALVAMVLTLAACGGGKEPAKRTPPAGTTPATSTAAPPAYSPRHVAAALIPGREIGPRVKPARPATPALKEHAVPSCSLSMIKPSGKPEVTVRELFSSRYTGANFGQIALTYPDAASAASMFSAIRATTGSCPAQRHVPRKRLSGRRFSIAHDDTWTSSADTVSGWTHLRGVEKDVYPRSSSVINVIYLAYDYVTRGNVVIASMYWQRVQPGTPEKTVTGKATELLAKQLAKLG